MFTPVHGAFCIPPSRAAIIPDLAVLVQLGIVASERQLDQHDQPSGVAGY